MHVWIYEDGGASVVGRGADLMIEKEDYRTPEALRTAMVNAVVGLVRDWCSACRVSHVARSLQGPGLFLGCFP